MRRRRQRGQALVELALVAPFMMVLFVGSAQVGVVAYGDVTIDTAAREGARMAALRPTNATFFGGSGATSATFVGCQASDMSANYVVQSVCRNAGTLDPSKITVTITKNIDVTSLLPRPDLRLAGTCATGYKSLSGSVTGNTTSQNAHVRTDADTSIDVVVSPSSTAFSVCVPNKQQTVTATVGSGCTGLSASASVSQNMLAQGQSVTLNLQPNPPCPTLIATTTALTASPSSVAAGQPVTLTATVTPASGGAPGGSVTFNDTVGGSTTALGTVTLSGGGAQMATSTLAPGNHVISALYNPDASHTGSSSSPVTVTVTSPASPTTTTLTASPTAAQQGQTVTLSVTVSGSAGTPTGSVTFTDFNGTTVVTLGMVTLSGGSAQLLTSTLGAGTHTVTANYGGDAGNAASASSPVVVVVSSSGTPGPPLPPPVTCPDPPTPTYIEVDVSYPIPVFVPFLSGLFSNAPGVRNVTVTQIARVAPCGITSLQPSS